MRRRTVPALVLATALAASLVGATTASASPPEPDPDSRYDVYTGEVTLGQVEEIVALGDHEEDKQASTRRKRPTSPALLHLADRLSDLFETRVKVDLGKSKGKITIEYASLDDLDRIVSTIDPSYERRPDPAAGTADGDSGSHGDSGQPESDMSASHHSD